MAKRPFAVGDVVILNSGGPKMTVAEVQPGQVRVVWVDDDDDLEVAWFPNACVYQVGCDADCGVA